MPCIIFLMSPYVPYWFPHESLWLTTCLVSLSPMLWYLLQTHIPCDLQDIRYWLQNRWFDLQNYFLSLQWLVARWGWRLQVVLEERWASRCEFQGGGL